jgi:hypothetical protein
MNEIKEMRVSNLTNILSKVLFLMQIAEEMTELSGEQKRSYVLARMKKTLKELFPSYEFEINTIIESVIFISKAGDLLINKQNKIKSSCFGFLK